MLQPLPEGEEPTTTPTDTREKSFTSLRVEGERATAVARPASAIKSFSSSTLEGLVVPETLVEDTEGDDVSADSK